MDDQTRKHYRRIRATHPTLSALQALRWARHESRVDALDRECDWEYPSEGDWGAFTVADFGDFTIRVYADPEPYDWGDCEPTEDEQRNLEVIGVGLRFAGAEQDHDSVWGIGYTSGDACREALSFAIEAGFIVMGRAERSEREAMACRGVVTV